MQPHCTLPYPQSKYCPKCETTKHIDDFSIDRAAKDLHCGKCKKCRREYRKKNPEQKKTNVTQSRKWAIENPERRKLIDKASAKRHWEKVKSNPELLEKNRARKNEFSKKNQKLHPEISRLAHSKRKARKYNCEGSHTQEEWLALCAHYGHVCLCCKETKPLTLDHVVPLSRGGSDSIDNLQPLCHQCNSRKGTKTIDYR